MTTRPETVRSVYAELGSDAPVVVSLLREQRDLPVVAAFTVMGEPASKARARWSGKTRTHYTPSATTEAEEKVAWAFRQAARGHRLNADDGFGVFAAFFCGTGQRRDVDNMLKLVLDGLNKVAWPDDSQVSEISGRVQRYAEDARTEVVVYRTWRQDRPTKACEQCSTQFETYPSTQKARRFCSGTCARQWRRENNRRSCEHCGNDYQGRPSQDRRYCSVACKSAAAAVTRTCTQCAKEFTRPRSLNKAGLPMCSTECRQEYWRQHRRSRASGTCADCGGPTSKKTYKRCAACALAASRAAPLSDEKLRWIKQDSDFERTQDAGEDQ